MKSGVKIRLRGLGFIKDGGTDRGDLYARLVVQTPTEEEQTPELIDVLEKLKLLGFDFLPHTHQAVIVLCITKKEKKHGNVLDL